MRDTGHLNLGTLKVKNWRKKFLKPGSVLDCKVSGRPSTSDDTEHCQSSRIVHTSFYWN
jgi:hypothetical protein